MSIQQPHRLPQLKSRLTYLATALVVLGFGASLPLAQAQPQTQAQPQSYPSKLELMGIDLAKYSLVDKDGISNDNANINANANLISRTDVLPTHTNQPDIEHLIQQTVQQNLAQHSTWLRLHYYKQKGKTGEYHSKVEELSKADNPAFFISKHGASDPQAELEAFIRAISKGDNSSQQIICRFPARTHWVTEQLGMPDYLQQADCPEFATWMTKLDPQRLSVVFAEEYPDNPVSAFAHTLMLIDSTQSLNDPSAIDKAHAFNDSVAGNSSDNSVVYTVKSMIGGYPNDITIEPYPDKLKHYLQKDKRDVWTFPLALTQAEVKQIVRHIWETKDLKLPYYFTNDNCASEILRHIDVVRPQGNLVDAFAFVIVPSDIIHLLDKQGLLQQAYYLPADDTLAQAKRNGQKGKQTNIANWQQLHNLPTSVIAKDNTLIPTHLVPVDNNPRHAHPVQRAMIGIGSEGSEGNSGGDGNRSYLSLGLRLASNDLLDRPQGYPQNFHIEGASIALRVYEDKEKSGDEQVLLQNLTVMRGRAYNPINTAHKGKTWGFELEVTQVKDGSNLNHSHISDSQIDPSHLVGSIGYQQGVAFAFGTPKKGSGEIPPHLCYALGAGTTQVGKGLNHGYRVGMGANIGCRYQFSPHLRIHGEASVPYWYHGDINLDDTQNGYWQPILNVAMQYDIDQTQAIRLEGTHQFHKQIEDKDDVKLSYVRYF